MKLDFSGLTKPTIGSNYRRTAAWLHACGKESTDPDHLSVQIGCHIEEFVEFLDQLFVAYRDGITEARITVASDILTSVAESLKSGGELAYFHRTSRERALDALCDMEVTGNGVAYLAGFDKEGADKAVLAANEAKLVDGKPVLMEGGKIGKPPGWKPADLSAFV